MQKSIYTQRYKRFTAALIEARKKAGMTQQQVADKLGRPQSFVAKYENGERRLDVVEFLIIAEAIKANAILLLRETELPQC